MGLSEGLNQGIDGVTKTISEVQGQVPPVDFANPTWDLFIYLLFAIAVVLFTITLGRQRVVSILLSIYLSLTVINALPYLDEVWSGDINLGIFAFKISSFVVAFVILFIILSRSAILHELAGVGRGIIQAFIFSFLLVGLLTSIVLGFLPVGAFNYISGFTKQLFISDLAKFFWIVMPILAMAIFRVKEED